MACTGFEGKEHKEGAVCGSLFYWASSGIYKSAIHNWLCESLGCALRADALAFRALFGTTEVVPCYKAVYEVSSKQIAGSYRFKEFALAPNGAPQPWGTSVRGGFIGLAFPQGRSVRVRTSL